MKVCLWAEKADLAFTFCQALLRAPRVAQSGWPRCSDKAPVTTEAESCEDLRLQLKATENLRWASWKHALCPASLWMFQCDSPFNYFRRAEIVWTMTLWATGSIKAFYSLPFWISGAQSGTTCNLSNQHLTSFLWLSTPCTHGAASGDSRNCWNEYIRKFVSLWNEAKDGWS